MDYVPSRFVVEKKFDDSVLLMATSTGAIVKLSPGAYTCWQEGEYEKLGLEQFLEWKFIVPAGTDELAEQKALREDQSEFNRLSLVIAPTLDCNARCWYCYEEGVLPITMSDDTANSIIEFVSSKIAGTDKRLKIMWFGGEPLMATEIIEKLTTAFLDLTDNYSALITTNGSMMTPDVVARYGDWRIKQIQVAIDGPEEITNRIKNYRDPERHNYRTTIENIKHVLRSCPEIEISLRVNFDRNNADAISKLSEELKPLLAEYKQLSIYSAPVICDPMNDVGCDIEHANRVANDFSRRVTDSKLTRSVTNRSLPRPKACMLHIESSFSVDPEGNMYRCQHDLGRKEKTIGNVRDGSIKPVDYDVLPRCQKCAYLPLCQGGCAGMEGSNIGRCAMLPQYVDVVLRQYYDGKEVA